MRRSLPFVDLATMPDAQFAGFELLRSIRSSFVSPSVVVSAACCWAQHWRLNPGDNRSAHLVFGYVMISMQHFVGDDPGNRFGFVCRMASDHGYSKTQYYLDIPTLLAVMLQSQAANLWQVIHLKLAEYDLEPDDDAAAAAMLSSAVCHMAFWRRHALVSDCMRALISAIEKIVPICSG